MWALLNHAVFIPKVMHLTIKTFSTTTKENKITEEKMQTIKEKNMTQTKEKLKEMTCN